MARIDAEARARFSVPGLLLMEHAAQATLRACLRFGPLRGKRVKILCGVGNNGGDGTALARLVQRLGARPTVILAGDRGKVKGDAATNLRAAEGLGIRVLTGAPSEHSHALGADLVVDALLGTGARGPVRGPALPWVEGLVQRRGRFPVVSVDVPSGVPADGGVPEGPFVQADLTVCMGLPKPFAVCPVAREAAGDVAVARIGFPAAQLETLDVRRRLLVSGEVSSGLPRFPAAAHKGGRGKVLVWAGSPGMEGAASLAARAALRAGAGMVQVLGPPGGRAILQAALPEAMVLERTAEVLSGRLGGLLEWADALVVGPGLGEDPGGAEALVRVLGSFPGPVVVDADGLRRVEGGCRWPGVRVLTPHPGEAARMLGERIGPSLPEREAAAVQLARQAGAWVLLKGRFSVLAHPDGVEVNPTGGPALATAGSGDVLAGTLGALLAARDVGGEASPSAGALGRVRAGVYLHGLAGDLGAVGSLAGELADGLVAARAALADAGGGDEEDGYPAVREWDRVELL